MKYHNGGHFLLRVGGRERPFPHARWLSYAAETAQCCGAWSDCHQPTYFAGFQTVHSFFILFLHYSCAGFLDGSHFCSGVAFVE